MRSTLKRRFVVLVCLFRLYPPVKRKRRWRYTWMKPHPLRSCPFPSFSIVFLTSYHWICCLFEATKQR